MFLPPHIHTPHVARARTLPLRNKAGRRFTAPNPPYWAYLNLGDRIDYADGHAITVGTQSYPATTPQLVRLNADDTVTATTSPGDNPTAIFLGEGNGGGHTVWLTAGAVVRIQSSLGTIPDGAGGTMDGSRVWLKSGTITVADSIPRRAAASANNQTKVVVKTTGCTTGAKGTLVKIAYPLNGQTSTTVSNLDTFQCLIYEPSDSTYSHPYGLGTNMQCVVQDGNFTFRPTPIPSSTGSNPGPGAGQWHRRGNRAPKSPKKP